MMNYRETTKHGYKILSLVDTGAMIAEDRPYLLAIAKRETDFKPYIFCDGYDLTNGTWGTGSYYDSFDDASVYLAKRLLVGQLHIETMIINPLKLSSKREMRSLKELGSLLTNTGRILALTKI